MNRQHPLSGLHVPRSRRWWRNEQPRHRLAAPDESAVPQSARVGGGGMSGHAWRQRTVIEHRSRITPELIGDAHDLAAIICLNLDGLQFLVGELGVHNHKDQFVWELEAALTKAESALAAVVEE
jgi:hypothetical protein